MRYKSEVADLNLVEIEANLKTSWLGRAKNNNELWNIIDSTNNRAIELVHSGADAGVIIIANQQTAGRGRAGNTWLSPANSGLYLSFIIKPKSEIKDLSVITLITGVAVVRAVQNCLGIKIGLKWVNDLILENKKIGGILIEYISPKLNGNELSETKDNSNNSLNGYLVIGMGLNLYTPSEKIPADLESKIIYLDSCIALMAVSIDRNKLTASLTNELEIVLESMSLRLPELLDQWRAYSITLGEEILANVGGNKIAGQAIDITDKGELIVKTLNGKVTLPAGEISVRKTDGSYV